jgi:hypothetical protein
VSKKIVAVVGVALLAWLAPGGVAVAGLDTWTTSGPEAGRSPPWLLQSVRAVDRGAGPSWDHDRVHPHRVLPPALSWLVPIVVTPFDDAERVDEASSAMLVVFCATIAHRVIAEAKPGLRAVPAAREGGDGEQDDCRRHAGPARSCHGLCSDPTRFHHRVRHRVRASHHRVLVAPPFVACRPGQRSVLVRGRGECYPARHDHG